MGTTSVNYLNIWFPLNETQYYWHVQSYNSNDGWGPYSSTWWFIVDTIAPTVPTITSPLNGTTIPYDEPTLSWIDDTDVYQYHVQMSNTSDFSYLLLDQAQMDNYYVFVDHLDEGQWFWRVRGRDYAFNYCNWTSANFTIDITAPGIPVLENPDNLATIGDSEPLLDWSSIDATLYQLQVSSIMNFSTLTYNVTTVDSFYLIPASLADGVWYWRVRGKDAAGNWGYWSAIWWFNLETVVVPELPNTAFAILLLLSGFLISSVVFRRKRK
jgi:hypothetical protein